MMGEQLYYVSAARFEAARRVGILPEGHRSARLHGHSFLAKVRTRLPAEFARFPGDEVEALQQRLESVLHPIDYCSLNEHLAVPTDENLARYLREAIALEGIDSVGIQSTSEQGADITRADSAHIWRRFRFEAAHQLPNVPAGHQCGRMHGHGFEVILHADQRLDGGDMGVDFDQLGAMWSPLQAELDHTCLNDIEGLANPTSEMLCRWIWERLKPSFPELSWVSVYETHSAGCHYDGSHYRIWKEFRFESALQLRRAPESERRRRLHGHSYLARLHLTAPLDEVFGWTVDYGDVKALFKPAYGELDHHCLNDLAGLDDADVASLLRWVKGRLLPVLPQLDRIDLYETPGCGGVLCWGEQGPALPV